MKSRAATAIILLFTAIGTAYGGPITIPTGGEFTASADACLAIPGFVCPPQALMTLVHTQLTGSTSGYGLEASLISNTTGATVPIDDKFLFVVITSAQTGEQTGAFEYNGLWAGFPFPTDFFGPNPATAGFSVRFKNTGLPFTFVGESPDDNVWFNLDSNNIRWAVTTKSLDSSVPEPGSVYLSVFGIILLVAKRYAHRR